MKTNRVLASAFSFLLPGLGQIYLRTYRRGLFFFALFAIMTVSSSLFRCIPFVMVLATWDSLQIPVTEHRERNSRIFLFSVVALVAFFLWGSVLAPSFLNLSAQFGVEDGVHEVEKEIRLCKEKTGNWPKTIYECLPKPPADPWGTAYDYKLTDVGFEIRSAGPDRVLHTQDDFLYHFR